MQKNIEDVFSGQGYRCLKTEEDIVQTYYKYYEEGFHVVLTVNLEAGIVPSAAEHRALEAEIMELFYHPVGRLADFPEGFPVYHVETLTLFIGNNSEYLRNLCTSFPNAWGFLAPERKLLIYEGQIGNFWGLQEAIENLSPEYEMKACGSFFSRQKQKLNEILHTNGHSLAYSTILLAIINIVVFLVLEIIGDTEDAIFIEAYGGMYPDDIRFGKEYWRFLTSGFLHFGAGHLMNNMVIFCCVGSRLERVIGHVKLFAIYIISTIGGSVVSYYMMLFSGNYAVSAGASGAVYGIIAGLLWAVIWHKGRLEDMTTKGLLFMLALSLYYGFSTIGVDNWGHIGGMVVGFFVSIILYHQKY